MIDRIGERFEGTVSAFVGAGAFVNLDEPFVDVMVKVEDLGGDFQIEDDGLMATSGRSGEAIRLGDRLLVDVTDVAILRRTIYARRVGAGARQDSFARGKPQKQRGFDPRDGSPRFGKKGKKRDDHASHDDRRDGRNKGGPGPARARKGKGKGKGKGGKAKGGRRR
jgi:ribonuclease R